MPIGAQTGTSTIGGAVEDASGLRIPAAAIRLVNEQSGSAIETASNESGLYRAASLPPGNYRVEAEMAGFQKLVRGGFHLAVSETLAVDLVLQLGAASESVNIESSEPLVQSQSSSAGQLIGREMVNRLPLPNRAATALVALAPGVVMIDSGTGAENYPLFSVAGGRARNQDFTLDGGNVSNAVGLTRPQQMTSLPLDAMQEFRVIANNYSAEYGHSTGGVITLSTRSGANSFHGDVFDYMRNDALDARNFFAAERAPIRLQQFGAAFGGPIRKDKTHFFATWEQTRETNGATVVTTVPNLQERLGNFSGLANSSGSSIAIYDPATTSGRLRSAFPGNVIPASRFDPVAAAVLKYWPLPNRNAGATGANNFSGNNKSLLHRNIVVARLDHQLRPNDLLTARYYINDSSTDASGSYGIPVADPDSDRTDVRVQSFLAGYTHVFRPSLINEFKYSFLQRKFIDTRPGEGQNLASAIGLSGVGAAAFPIFTVPGYAALSNSPERIQTPIRDSEFQNALSWYRGKHALKFGLEHRRGFNNEIRDRSSSGQFTTTPLITAFPGQSGTGDAFASFLLGEINAASVQVSDLIPSRAYYWAWYVQDDWRLTDRLTLNAGVRWESEIPRRVDGDRQNSFDPAALNPVSGTPGVVTFSGRNGTPRQAFNTDLNNFGPRFGFAYRVPKFERTVIRGGAGIFYGPTVSNSIGDAATNGFSTSASLVASQADTLSALQLRNGFPVYQRPALDAGFGAVAPGQKPNTAVTFFERNRPTPVSYQYNLDVQHEIDRGIVIETGYIGNVSHHLTGNDLSIDQVAPGLMGPGDAQSRRPFPQFSNVSIINAAVGNSTYHAGYVKAEKRFTKGFSFLAHYTFSKFLDDVPSSVEYGDSDSFMNAYNRRLDKGLSGSDVPQRAILSGLYEAPAWKNNRIWNAALGAWNLGVICTLQSGGAFTVITTANTTNAYPAGPLRPDLVGNPNQVTNGRSIAQWFNTAAFRNPAPYTFGTAPRDGLRGPSQKTVDLTLAKQFRATERYKADLRAEFYNLLNHANFDLPGHTLGAADLGIVSSARPGRAVQVGLRVSF